MATQDVAGMAEAGSHHTRTKSSVLRSFMHKRSNSKGAGLTSIPTIGISYDSHGSDAQSSSSCVPEDQDQSHLRALGEIHNYQNQPTSPSKKTRDDAGGTTASRGRSLHKKTLSAISLRSLAGRDGNKQAKSRQDSPEKPKKTKSSTNLATLLSRSKSRKNLRVDLEELFHTDKDKENRTPSGSSPAEATSRPPIYAQFSSEQFATQPLGGKFLEDGIDLHTPQQCSPGKQRKSHESEGVQPTPCDREKPKMPSAIYLPSSFSVQDISRSNSDTRQSSEQSRFAGSGVRPSFDRQTTFPQPLVAQKNVRTTEMSSNHSKVHPESRRDITDVAVEFEAMLDRRNIPENQRYKMRNIAESIKIDMIRQDWAETAATAASQTERPGTNSSMESNEDIGMEEEVKAKKPRSRTFTLSRSSKDLSSPPKKAKPEGTLSRHMRTKSRDSAVSERKPLTAPGTSMTSTLIAKAKGQLPDDFVNYLRKVSKPEVVEVGKLHKLRLLLRNETVAWTDNFIGLGGMKEIVGLLHRTLEVEWREEHEDALLHEVLLCLKALCTTSLALEYLSDIQGTLFPVLIHMLFDEERKGPSEFTTRNIVTSLLFTYLKSAALSERPQRARTLLSYLRDPQPKEEERPVPFVLEMHRERPYRVWNKEVLNVTKEVFWIFLHNLNVIALPSPEPESPTSEFSDNFKIMERGLTSHSLNPQYAYMVKHFPQELPPVAAAPYVGGVEWDATNYLTSHLDLVNGILASLETRQERMVLREQLLVSGWERCMGGTLRTCKEKFYGGVHAALRCWVAAGLDDGWDVSDVRCGPRSEHRSPVRKSPKKKVEEAPKLEMPKLDFGLEKREERRDDAWL